LVEIGRARNIENNSSLSARIEAHPLARATHKLVALDLLAQPGEKLDALRLFAQHALSATGVETRARAEPIGNRN